MTKKTAILVNDNLRGFHGQAQHYRLSEPLEGHEHVVVSAVVAYSGAETLIFGADKHGRIVDWTDLPGSDRGHLDHEQALRDAGYEVIS